MIGRVSHLNPICRQTVEAWEAGCEVFSACPLYPSMWLFNDKKIHNHPTYLDLDIDKVGLLIELVVCKIINACGFPLLPTDVTAGAVVSVL